MTAATHVRHGYTMQDLHSMAKQACRADRSLASDMDTRYNAAWSAIALALCEAEDPPDRHDLVTIGWQAIYREVKEMRGIFGFKDRDGTTEVASSPRYVQYWYVRPERADEGIVERAAVHQIMATIPELYREAVVALAVHDDYQVAAESLGIKYSAFTARMTVARRKFRMYWFAPETAPPIKGTDRRVRSYSTEPRTHCAKAGHELTPDNIYRRPNPKPGHRGERSCKKCEQIRGQDRVAARRQAVNA
jgi:DNA-directed RNA polymerase specialized sigma24 family protein